MPYNVLINFQYLVTSWLSFLLHDIKSEPWAAGHPITHIKRNKYSHGTRERDDLKITLTSKCSGSYLLLPLGVANVWISPCAAFNYTWIGFTNSCGSLSFNSWCRHSERHVHHKERLLQRLEPHSATLLSVVNNVWPWGLSVDCSMV